MPPCGLPRLAERSSSVRRVRASHAAWPRAVTRVKAMIGTAVGHARHDRGPHAGATGPRGTCASGPPPGIQPNDIFICFSNF
jgi:hypothetical protein